MNGRLIPWDEARIHIRTDAVMYGANVFEGIRAYSDNSAKQLYIFRLHEHLDRLFNTSMRVLRMKIDLSADEFSGAILELIHANDFRDDIHIRPTVYFGAGEPWSFDPAKIEILTSISAIPMPTSPRLQRGIQVCVSSWRRLQDTSLPPRVKAGANYLQARYVSMEATVNGYDGAIILNEAGKVAEGPGACFMMLRGGRVVTPPVTAGILESITRLSLMELIRHRLGVEVVERDIDRTELYLADEAFFCGTAAEVLPIIGVDRYAIGSGEVGRFVRSLQDLYFSVARGKESEYAQWLTPVY
jgi:branched-chain amino acid aminotransferase